MTTILIILGIAFLVLAFLLLRAFRSFLHPADEGMCLTRIEGTADYGNYIVRGCQIDIEIVAVRPEKIYCPFCGKKIKYVEAK